MRPEVYEGRLFIDGELREAHPGNRFEVVNPAELGHRSRVPVTLPVASALATGNTVIPKGG